MRPRGEHLAQDRGNPPRFLIDLLVAQALHVESKRAQLEISSPVIAERLLATMVLVAVGFDYEPEIPPNEICLVLANLNVDLGHWQAVSPADPQEVALEVAAGAIVVDVIAERQAEHLGLPNRPAKLPGRCHSPQILDCPRRRGYRYVATASEVMGPKGSRSVQTDSIPSPSTTPTRDRDVDEFWIALQQTPKGSGTAMADHGIPSTCKDSGHPPALRTETTVPNRIHPAVNPMERPTLHACRDRVSSQSTRDELSERDNAVLPLGNTGNPKVGRGAFFPHVGEEVATPKSSPPTAPTG
jgi:hypothetical protein